MKEHANATISDEAFSKRHIRWPTDTPDTKEAYYIREIFDGSSTLFFYSTGFVELVFHSCRSLPIKDSCGDGGSVST